MFPVLEIAQICLICMLYYFLMDTNFFSIPAPEITTTERKINVNSILYFILCFIFSL